MANSLNSPSSSAGAVMGRVRFVCRPERLTKKSRVRCPNSSVAPTAARPSRVTMPLGLGRQTAPAFAAFTPPLALMPKQDLAKIATPRLKTLGLA